MVDGHPGAGMAINRDACQVVTFAPDGTQPRVLGTLGHVQGLAYDSVLPGGDDQLSLLLQVDPGYRSDALNPGRICRAYRNSDLPLWDGNLAEAQPSQDGWQVTATGRGVQGADFQGYYATWNLNDPINQAITRGLRWKNAGSGITSGWLLQKPDVASFTITDHMTNITSKQGLTWSVGRDGIVTVFPIPAVANRLLVCTDPVPRTLYADLTTVYLKYTSSDDGQGNTAYATTVYFNQAAINVHNAHETYVDLSDAGVMSAATAQGVGKFLLSKYTRAAWSGSFAIRPGQLMTMGGAPVDPATERAGNVYRLLVNDAPYGGEVNAGPIEFPGGQVDYDDDSGTSAVTPLQSYQTDIGSVLSNFSK